MKKICLFLFCLLTITCNAQNMPVIFGNMPKKLSLPVDSIGRQDLMDIYKEKGYGTVKNKFNETVELKSMTDNYLKLESGNSSFQIILLPLINDSKIICTIQTVCAPACDSKINFYTTQWKQLETSGIFQPAEVSWFIKENVDKSDAGFENAVKSLDMDLMQYDFDVDKMKLIQTYITPKYLSEEDKKAIEPYLKQEPKIFEWQKMSFK